MNTYESQEAATTPKSSTFRQKNLQMTEQSQHFEVPVNAISKNGAQPHTLVNSGIDSANGVINNNGTSGNPYAHYFSKRKEKQSNERSNVANPSKVDNKFMAMKSNNNMLRLQQQNKNLQLGFPTNNKQLSKNIQERTNMSVKSLGSQKLSEQSGKGGPMPVGQKLNLINNSIHQNYRHGAGLNNHQMYQQQQNGGINSNVVVSQQTSSLQRMSQIYGSAEAILTNHTVDMLTSDTHQPATGMRSIDADGSDKPKNTGSSLNQQSISYRNDSQQPIQYPYNNQNQQFLKKNNQKTKKLNELLVMGSKKSSSSVQKSPMNQRQIEDNLNDILQQQVFNKKLKRDASYPDQKVHGLSQAQNVKQNQFLNVSIDNKQLSTINSQSDQTQMIQQMQMHQNKRSPGKLPNQQRNANASYQSNAQPPSRNTKHQNLTANPSSVTQMINSQQLRNQKQSTSQKSKAGHQVLVHPSSMSKMQQIKNIYSNQIITQNKSALSSNYNAGGESLGHTSGLNTSMLEITNYNNNISLQSSSLHFNGGQAVTSETPQRNQSQNSNYQGQVNLNVLHHNNTTTDLSLVSKTISIKGKTVGHANKRNAAAGAAQTGHPSHQQYTTNEYGTAISPKGDISDIQFANQRKSQQSQKTAYNKAHGAERDSIAIAKKNAANPHINTINSSMQVGISGSALINSYQQPTQSSKIQKVQINKQLQKQNAPLKNTTSDNSLRNTQKSQWNITGAGNTQASQNSKVNSYYNTKSSFGIRNSNKNQAKQSIDYSKMEVRGKGGQINQTSIKQSKNTHSNNLPKTMKMSSNYNKDHHQTTSSSVVEISKHLNSNRIQSRNILNKGGQKTESIPQGNHNDKQRMVMAGYQEGPTSRSLEPKETLDMGVDSSANITNIQNFIQDTDAKKGKKQLKNGQQQFENNFLQEFDHHSADKQYTKNSQQIPLIRNYNTSQKASGQVQIINQKSNSLESAFNNGKQQDAVALRSSLMHTQQHNDKGKISKTEAHNSQSKKQLHSFVDNKIEQSNLLKGGDDSSRQQDAKSLEAVDYFHQQGKAYKQHMKSQQLKSRLKNLQYSQAATESQHSMLEQKVNLANIRGPKPNLDNKSSNQNSNIQSSVVSVKHQLPQINNNVNQSKSETKITNKFDTQIKAQKGKHDSVLSMQKSRNQMTEERNAKVQSKIDSPDQLSDQQTALKTPQNNSKMYKKNFQYSQNVAKNLTNIDQMNKKTALAEQSSTKLAVPDSDIDIGQNSTSNNNTKIDVNSQEPTSALNDSYENINVPNMINLFSKRKQSNLNISRLDDKYSPQIKDTASYSSMERPAGKQSGNHPHTVNKETAKYKIYRKNQKLEALNNQSDGSFPNVNNDQLTDELRFAPMNGVRDGFGVGPGTANTHGGYTRQKYKRNQDQSNMNYKLPSQQCYSEIVNFDNQQNVQQVSQNFPVPLGDNNQDFNIISTFEQSFEYAFDPTNFQNLDALDPKEEFDLHAGKNFDIDQQKNHQLIDGQSSIPSIHSVPVVRNQKSQSTYRHNHQKISVSNKYHYYNQHGLMQPSVIENNALGQNSITQQQFDNMTNLNVSQISGQHDMMPNSGYMVHRQPLSIKEGQNLNSRNGKQDLTSFLNNVNDAKINASQISQLSNDSDIGGLTTDMIIHNGGTRTTHNGQQNQVMYLSKRDTSAPHITRENSQPQHANTAALSQSDESHPFGGPKLHLFKRGQSKSSQTKQRKIKTSQFLQRIHEKNSNYSNLQNYNNSIIQNYGQGNNVGGAISAPSAQSMIGPNGFSATQSQHLNSNINYRQLSEGGPINSLKKKSHSNTRKPKEGHINISEILNGNQKLPSSKFVHADQLHTDTRSQNSQELISQNSNEFGTGPPKGINIGDPVRNMNEMELQSQSCQQTYNKEMLMKERDNNSNELPASGLMENQFDGRIQNTPSQFSTIQQNVSANMFDDGESQDDQTGKKNAEQSDVENNGNNFHFPMLAGAVSSKSNAADSMNQFSQMSPYIGAITSTQRLGYVRKMQNESLQLPVQGQNGSNQYLLEQNETYMQRIYEQQKQGMRPNTTNPTDMILNGNHELNQKSPDSVIQKPKIPVQKLLKPLKGTSHSNQSFKHPKIGNNSKHPEVFKNLQQLPGRKGVMQTKSQTQLRGAVPGGAPNGQIGAGMHNSNQKLPNGFHQLGLMQSHSQDYVQTNKLGQMIKDEVAANGHQMPQTDKKKTDNNDLLNETQITDTDLNHTNSKDERTNLSQYYKENEHQIQESPLDSATIAENISRNQHFETTFEGFNKKQKKDQSSPNDDKEQDHKQNTAVKIKANSQQSEEADEAMYVTPMVISRQQSIKNGNAATAAATKFKSQEQQSRNTGPAQMNSHKVPIQQRKVNKTEGKTSTAQQQTSAEQQANMAQLNQLMDQDIDKNELSNTSARKAKMGERDGLMQRSIDAKNIQLLREKSYQEERNKFQSENKQVQQSHSKNEPIGGVINKNNRNMNNKSQQEYDYKAQQNKQAEQSTFSKNKLSSEINNVSQVNGLNSINSVVPSSPIFMDGRAGSGDVNNYQSAQSVKNVVSKQLKVRQEALNGQANQKSVKVQQSEKDIENEERSSSIAVEEVSPSPLNDKIKNRLSSSPEENITSEDQQNNDNLVVSANAGGINMNQTQTSHSIAQTPCFAETPNTTDQFKGYKIDPNDRINMSGMMLNTQQLNLPQNLMASSNGMVGISVSGSNRGGGGESQDNKTPGSSIMTPQMGQVGGTSSNSRPYHPGINVRGKSATINNKPSGVLTTQPYNHEIVESESLLESEAEEQEKRN